MEVHKRTEPTFKQLDFHKGDDVWDTEFQKVFRARHVIRWVLHDFEFEQTEKLSKIGLGLIRVWVLLYIQWYNNKKCYCQAAIDK